MRRAGADNPRVLLLISPGHIHFIWCSPSLLGLPGGRGILFSRSGFCSALPIHSFFFHSFFCFVWNVNRSWVEAAHFSLTPDRAIRNSQFELPSTPSSLVSILFRILHPSGMSFTELVNLELIVGVFGILRGVL